MKLVAVAATGAFPQPALGPLGNDGAGAVASAWLPLPAPLDEPLLEAPPDAPVLTAPALTPLALPEPPLLTEPELAPVATIVPGESCQPDPRWAPCPHRPI
jgi:hypothetical protein